jgi:hypothetical protein
VVGLLENIEEEKSIGPGCDTKKEISMRVIAEITEDEVVSDEGHSMEGIRATCSRCAHTTESCGTDAPSIRRCLSLLREECPKGESNFYVEK